MAQNKSRRRGQKIIGKIFYLVLRQSEFSQNPLLRMLGGFLRASTPYFSIDVFYYSWFVLGRKSTISWFSFVARSILGQFTTFVFPAQRCQMEKRQLTISREKDESSKEYTEEILVSVVIPTYNRSELLTSHAVPSVLNQTHRNLRIDRRWRSLH